MLQVSEKLSDEQAGDLLLSRYIFVHLDKNEEKFELLLHMLRKLYAFVAGEAAEDNADALNNQEILLCGHLFTSMIKEKFEEFLLGTIK
jgi:DNA-directed RNA polymerase I subunit RPA2